MNRGVIRILVFIGFKNVTIKCFLMLMLYSLLLCAENSNTMGYTPKKNYNERQILCAPNLNIIAPVFIVLIANFFSVLTLQNALHFVYGYGAKCAEQQPNKHTSRTDSKWRSVEAERAENGPIFSLSVVFDKTGGIIRKRFFEMNGRLIQILCVRAHLNLMR